MGDNNAEALQVPEAHISSDLVTLRLCKKSQNNPSWKPDQRSRGTRGHLSACIFRPRPRSRNPKYTPVRFTAHRHSLFFSPFSTTQTILYVHDKVQYLMDQSAFLYGFAVLLVLTVLTVSNSFPPCASCGRRSGGHVTMSTSSSLFYELRAASQRFAPWW